MLYYSKLGESLTALEANNFHRLLIHGKSNREIRTQFCFKKKYSSQLYEVLKQVHESWVKESREIRLKCVQTNIRY